MPLSMLGWTLSKVREPYNIIQWPVVNADDSEFINGQDRFTYVRDALKTLNKMDFDKLIVSVPNFSYSSYCAFLTKF
jgi:hypothetical protein